MRQANPSTKHINSLPPLLSVARKDDQSLHNFLQLRYGDGDSDGDGDVSGFLITVLSAGKGQREREGGREGRERGEREGEGREGRERGKEGGGRELEGWRGGRVSIN